MTGRTGDGRKNWIPDQVRNGRERGREAQGLPGGRVPEQVQERLRPYIGIFRLCTPSKLIIVLKSLSVSLYEREKCPIASGTACRYTIGKGKVMSFEL
jgi:hypothetical protein